MHRERLQPAWETWGVDGGARVRRGASRSICRASKAEKQKHTGLFWAICSISSHGRTGPSGVSASWKPEPSSAWLENSP